MGLLRFSKLKLPVAHGSHTEQTRSLYEVITRESKRLKWKTVASSEGFSMRRPLACNYATGLVTHIVSGGHVRSTLVTVVQIVVR